MKTPRGFQRIELMLTDQDMAGLRRLADIAETMTVEECAAVILGVAIDQRLQKLNEVEVKVETAT